MNPWRTAHLAFFKVFVLLTRDATHRWCTISKRSSNADFLNPKSSFRTNRKLVIKRMAVNALKQFIPSSLEERKAEGNEWMNERPFWHIVEASSVHFDNHVTSLQNKLLRLANEVGSHESSEDPRSTMNTFKWTIIMKRFVHPAVDQFTKTSLGELGLLHRAHRLSGLCERQWYAWWGRPCTWLYGGNGGRETAWPRYEIEGGLSASSRSRIACRKTGRRAGCRRRLRGGPFPGCPAEEVPPGQKLGSLAPVGEEGSVNQGQGHGLRLPHHPSQSNHKNTKRTEQHHNRINLHKYVTSFPFIHLI